MFALGGITLDVYQNLLKNILSCFQTVDGQFILSFTYRFPEYRGATSYFTFCYPWSYTESQDCLEQLDKKFQDCKNFTSER